MATSKPPKHDFAPAWLKIPEQDAVKPGGPKSTDQEKPTSRPNRCDDYFSGGYNRYGNHDYTSGPLQRQRSFDNYHDGEHDRRFSPQRFRHHSIDDDFYGGSYNCGPGYYNGYNYEKYGNHYRSQPSLYKDGKYTHPNARYGGQPQPAAVNGGFGPYPPYDYYDYYGGPGDPYYNTSTSYGRPPPPPGSKRPPYPDRDSKHPSAKGDRERDATTKESTGMTKKGDSIEYDFPSLNGDVERPQPKPLGTSGVWDKPLNTKGMSNGNANHPDDNQYSSADTTNKDFALSKNNNVYKAQLTAKGSVSKRQLNRDVGKGAAASKDVNSNNKDNLSGNDDPLAKNGCDVGKENISQSPASSPIDIHNVWSAAATGGKKNGECSKPAKGGDGDSTDEKIETDTDVKVSEDEDDKAEPSGEGKGQQLASLVNGIDDLSLGSPHLDDKLSSSLEAEQRLLKEMGWNEMDNDDCFITEEEIQEFQKLKELKGQKNGFTKPALPKVWSPQHKAVYPPALPDLNDTLSSTSEDSDSDLD